MSDDRPEDEIRESWEKVQAAHLVVREAEAKVARHQTDLKKAKAALELAVLKRDALLNGETKEYPLFDGEEKEDQAESDAIHNAESDAWRAVKLGEVMGPAENDWWQLNTLSDRFDIIETVGELFDLLTLAHQTFDMHEIDRGPRRGYLIDDIFDESGQQAADAAALTTKLVEWGHKNTPWIEWELILRPRPKTWRDEPLDGLVTLANIPAPGLGSPAAKAIEKLQKKNYHKTLAHLARSIDAEWTPRQFGLSKDELEAVKMRLKLIRGPRPKAEESEGAA